MTPNKHKKCYYIISMAAIILLGFGMRWHFINTAQVINPVRGDAAQYFQYALNLKSYGVFSGAREHQEQTTPPPPDSYRDPGYPLFLAGILKISPNLDAWYKTTLITQTLLGSLTILFTMLLAEYWLPRKWVLVTGLFIATWPHCVIFSGYLLTETLVSFLCTFGLWLLSFSYKKDNIFALITAGIALSSAALSNAILLPFGLVLGVLGLLMKSSNRKFWFMFIISFLLLPSSWAVRNAQLPTDSKNNSSYRAYQNLVQGSWPSYHKAYKGSFEDDATSKEIMKQIDVEINLLAEHKNKGVEVIMQRLLSEPRYYIYWYVIQKPILLWDWEIGIGQNDIYVYPTINSPLDSNPLLRAITSLMHGFVYIIILLGFICILGSAYKNKDVFNGENPNGQIAFFSCLIMIIYVTSIYTLFQSEPRYSIPFKPFGFLLAATAAHYIYLSFRNYRDAHND